MRNSGIDLIGPKLADKKERYVVDKEIKGRLKAGGRGWVGSSPPKQFEPQG